VTITLRREGALAFVHMDDGKANAFDADFFAELTKALDETADADALVIAGREGMFSGGLNLKALGSLDPESLLDMMVGFARTMHRIWLEPRPVVAAVTGHAVAGGTILAMASDHAVAADGPFRWGLNETAIGLAFPSWILAITRANVRNDRIEGLLLSGALISPAEALEVGYADEVVPADQVLAAAEAKASALAALPRAAYAATKQRLRGEASRASLDVTESELRAMMGQA